MLRLRFGLDRCAWSRTSYADEISLGIGSLHYLFRRATDVIGYPDDRHTTGRFGRDLGGDLTWEWSARRRADDDVIDVVRACELENGGRNVAGLKKVVGDLAPRQLQRLRPGSQFRQLLDMDVLSRCIDILFNSQKRRRHDVNASEPRTWRVCQHRRGGFE